MRHGWHPKHPLKRAQLRTHWACHGCESTDPDVLPLWRDDVRYRCSKCDFDLCTLCFNEEIEFVNSCSRRAEGGQDGERNRGASPTPRPWTSVERNRGRRCTINMAGQRIPKRTPA